VLLLDEATSNFDEATTRAFYRLLSERLPDTIIISIGKSPVLAQLHRRKISLDRVPDTAPTAATMAPAPA
jgi:putative ATP-binding cassette transporter